MLNERVQDIENRLSDLTRTKTFKEAERELEEERKRVRQEAAGELKRLKNQKDKVKEEYPAKIDEAEKLMVKLKEMYKEACHSLTGLRIEFDSIIQELDRLINIQRGILKANADPHLLEKLHEIEGEIEEIRNTPIETESDWHNPFKVASNYNAIKEKIEGLKAEAERIKKSILVAESYSGS